MCGPFCMHFHNNVIQYACVLHFIFIPVYSSMHQFLQLYYLDWLDHPAGPEDRFRTPRISMFTSDMVTNLSRADVVHEGQAIACYGTLNVSFYKLLYCLFYNISIMFL